MLIEKWTSPTAESLTVVRLMDVEVENSNILRKVLGISLLKRGHQILTIYSYQNYKVLMFMKICFTGSSLGDRFFMYLQTHSKNLYR